MRRIITCLILLTIYSDVFSQDEAHNFAKMVDFLPPPPNAASIIKNGMVAVNKNTGAPNISLPLTSIQGQKLSASISLSYNSTGIKVDEVSGRVGMGWSINAGGVVIRTLRGAPDESNTRIGIYDPFGANCGSYDFLRFAVDNTSGYDAEPDLFNFNMNGISGSFVFDASVPRKAISLSPDGNKIEFDFSFNAAWNFKITTVDGIKYYFGGPDAVEKSKRDQSCGKLFDNFVSNAWYLLKIEHPNGELIDFTYSSHTYTYDNGVSESMTWSQYCGGPSYKKCINRITTQGKILSSISNAFTKIDFTYINRSDITDKLLYDIKIYNKAILGIINTRFEFLYNQQIGNAAYHNEYSLGQDKTPYLTNLIERSTDLAFARNHSFQYFQPSGRPHRLSFSQDHWGFFNGVINNSFVPLPTDPLMASRFPNATANRNVSENEAKKGLLTKIIYPTGGSDEIEYESNKFYNAGVHSNVGGLRVKRILSRNADESPIIKKYYYGDISTPENSSLHNENVPVYVKSYQTRNQNNEYCEHIGQYSNSLNSLAAFQNSPVSYASVIEGYGDNFEGGAIQSKFRTFADARGIIIQGNEMLGAPLTNFSNALNGKLEEEIIFKKLPAGSLFPIKKTFNEYYLDPRVQSEIKGYSVFQKYINYSFPYCPTPTSPLLTNSLESYDVMRFDILSYWVYLKKTTQTDYDENGNNPVVNSKDFFYENTDHLQLTRVETYDSKNNLINKIFKYPHDYIGIPVYADMVSQHIISPVINYKETKSNSPSIEVHTTYTNAGNLNFVPSLIQKSFLTYDMFSEGTFNSYDTKGNLLEYIDKGGIFHSIIWGYGDHYPIAKITGSTYAQAIAQLSVPVSSLQAMTDIDLLTELNRIRTGLPAAFVTTYTYKNLAGVISITDPNNKKSSYDYDSFNRLSQVRDQDNNVVKKICYNYAGQPENCLTPCTNTNPIWENTDAALTCQQMANYCGNTGYQLQEQKDVNPCSSTYNQNQFIVAGYNASACPPTTNVAVTYQALHYTQGYTATYTNISTNTSYIFTIPLGSGTLGCVPVGYYNVSIDPPAGITPPWLLIGCGPSYVSGTSATFSNINLNKSFFRSISIDYDY